MGIHAGIVRILGDSDGATTGTGFVVSHSIVVTCAHVVEAAGGEQGELIKIQFYNAANSDDAEQLARVDAECWSLPNEQDIAILRLESPLPTGVEPLRLGTSPKLPGHSFISFGFPVVGKYDELPVEGNILGHIRDDEGLDVLVLDSGNIYQGMSGAPVQDVETGLIVGMIDHFPSWTDRERRKHREIAGDPSGRLQNINFASTSETIIDLCLDLQLSDREPYLGLRTFSEEEADLFYGRKAFVDALIERLRIGASFIAIVGPSGSGKSSAIFAGLFPKLRQGTIAGSRVWQLVSFRPGSDPYEELAAEGIVTDEETNLADAVTDYLEQNPDAKHLVLFADQFEEVFALCPEPTRTQFLNEWTELVEQVPGLSLILTLQAGYYYGMALEHPQLGALINKGQETILRMDDAEMSEAVSGPADEVGLSFEKGLVEDIVAEAAQVKHPLPLVQESLSLLWNEEKESGSLPMLTHETYRESVGGVAGAIQRRATKVYNSLPNDEQETAKHVFTRLVHYGEGDEGNTLQKLLLSDLVTKTQDFEIVQRVSKKLADERLLVTGEETDVETQTVEIIHRVLIEEWDKLEGWIEEQEGFLLWLQRLNERLDEWEEQDFNDDLLLRGPLLAEAMGWLETNQDDLTEKQLEFIEESESAQKKGERRRNAVLAAAVIAAIAMAILAWFAFDRSNEATKQAEVAETNSMALATEVGIRATAEADALDAQQVAESERNRAEENADALAEEVAVRATAEAEAIANASAAATSEASAVQARIEAEKQQQLSEARALAARASEMLSHDPDQALLLAYQSVQKTTAEGIEPVSEAYAALHATLTQLGQPKAVLRGHTDRIYSAGFDRQGNRVLTASTDGTARLWSVDGNTLAELKGHEAPVWFVLFNPDETKILTTSSDTTARLWDLEGQPLAILEGHTSEVFRAVFNADGTRIATAAMDNTARLWDSEGQEIVVLEGHTDGVVRVVFSPDETKILTASFDDTARLWDADGNLLIVLQDHTDNLIDAKFSPDGNNIATASYDGTARLWDLDGNTIAVLEGHTDILTSVAFSPDGTLIATTSADNSARLWDREGRSLAVLNGHTDNVISAQFSFDGTKLITNSSDSTARLWRSDGQPIGVLVGHMGRVWAAQFSSDASRIVTAGDDRTARLWDGFGQPVSILKGHSDFVFSTVFYESGTKILTASVDETVRQWDEKGNLLAVLEGHTDDVLTATFNKDETRIVTASADNTARIWDATGNPLSVLEGHTEGVMSAQFSPDGSRILTTSFDNTARLWQEDGELLEVLDGHDDVVFSASYSPDGSRIVTAGLDGTVRLWDADGHLIEVLEGHTGKIWQAVFNEDGTRILTGSEDKTARLWDENGHLLTLLEGHEAEVFSVDFDPQGTLIVTGSYDDTVGLWDNNGKLLTVLEGHNGDVTSVSFNRAGTQILSLSTDGTARIWGRNGQPLLVLAGHSDSIRTGEFNLLGDRVVTGSWDMTASVWQIYPDSQSMITEAEQLLPRLLSEEECVEALNKDLCESQIAVVE